MELFHDLKPEVLVASVAYTLLGLSLFGGSLWIITKVVPFSVRKEIEEDQNTALGIMIGCMFLGIAIIVAAAIH